MMDPAVLKGCKQLSRNDSAELCLAVVAIATVKSRNRGYRQGGSFNRATKKCRVPFARNSPCGLSPRRLIYRMTPVCLVGDRSTILWVADHPHKSERSQQVIFGC